MRSWPAPAGAGLAWAAILASQQAGLRGAWAWTVLLLGAAVAASGLGVVGTRRSVAGRLLLHEAGLLRAEAAQEDPAAAMRERILAAARGAPASPGDSGAPERDERPRWPVLGVAVVMAGTVLVAAGWAGVRTAAPGRSALLAGGGGGLQADVVMASDASEGAFGWSAAATLVSVERDGRTVRLHEVVWLQGRERAPPLELGDRVRLSGSAGPPPGEGGFADYLRSRGVAVVIRVYAAERTGGPSNPLLVAANTVRRSLRRATEAILPQPRGGLFLGLAVGDTSRLDPGVEEDFRATGLGHLLAVSGSNVAMFLAPILAAAAAAGAARRTRFAIGIAALAFFALLTRAEPSVMRASAMAGLGLMGALGGRARPTWAVLGTAVLGLLLWDPGLARALGFQLSVAATIGMVAFAGPVAARIPGPRAIALAAGATLGAQAAVTPLLLFQFNVVPTVTLPANLLAFAAIGPAMLLGLVACALWLVWPAGGQALAGLADLPLRYLTSVADTMATAPLPSITSGGSAGAFLLGMAVLAWLAFRVARGRRRAARRRPRRRMAPVLIAVALPVLIWTRAVPAGPPGSLEVIFFDVGQGDAALVRSPAGAAILIDAGPERDVVSAKLARLGVHRLDLVVATHPHADHVAGFPSVLARFGVGTVIEPGCGGDSPAHEAFVRAVRDEGLPVRRPHVGEVLTVADVRVEVLGPAGCHLGTSSDANNDSVVVRISIGEASVLFTGDAEEPAQEELLEPGTAGLEADVLKVPHHGGGTSLEEFLIAARARVAIVSVGQGNDYGHPVPAIIAILRAAGMDVVRTDESGDVTVRFGPDGVPLVQSARAA